MRICNPDKLSHIEFCRERIVIDERTGRVLKNSYQGIPDADSDEQFEIAQLVARLRRMVGAGVSTGRRELTNAERQREYRRRMGQER